MQKNSKFLEDVKRREDFAINTKARVSLAVITNKNKSPPQKSPQLMKLQSVLKKDKTFAGNAKLRLSIEDYKLICKNKILKKMMAKVLNTDVESLTAICEKIVDNVNKYVDLSLKTKKEKTKAKTLPIKDLMHSLPPNMNAETLRLFDLPDHLIENITHNSLKSLYIYKLINGIPAAKLDFKYLSVNPNAVDFLSSPENKNYINYSQLSKNTDPKAIKLLKIKIKANPDDIDISWNNLSANSSAFEILKAYKEKIVYKSLSYNTDPNAIELLKERIKINPDDINWQALSQNPNAIELLKANRHKIDWNHLSGNECAEAIELIEEEIKINPKNISWGNLSGNSILRAVELLEANPTKIVWGFLTSNTNSRAIKLLKENEDKITWSSLSSNPSAIALLNDRIKYENNLPQDVYNALKVFEKINWKNLSANPNAIEIIKKRIIYENNLPEDVYKALKMHEKISWEKLAENPSIFSRI
jgi:hypothetical protein